ncbi:MAG: YceI family protein [Phototrophicaceae bacterium]|jgi:polyisoprenoid-binding protein YceI
MNNRLVAVIAVICLAVGAGVGILGFIWLVGGDGTPSTQVSAPTLDANSVPTLNPEQAFAAVTEVAQLREQLAGLEATVSGFAANNVATTPLAPNEVATAEPTSEATEVVAAERVLFRIDGANSTVTFTLQEDLRGDRIDVIGTTQEVAGDIVIDPSNPSLSQIGTIRINARTLATDNENRNRALRSQILRSSQDEFEFIDFVPTALSGLPTTATVGESYTFDITGDLTIAGATNPVTFSTTLTATSATTLSGTATALVRWADWGIRIPSVPGVANITEEVTLAINFTANAVES